MAVEPNPHGIFTHIMIGVDSENMKFVAATWPSYTPSFVPDDSVADLVDGTLGFTQGPIRRRYTGEMEVLISRPLLSSDADYDFIESVWEHEGFIKFRDHTDTTYDVTWDGELSVSWQDAGANLCRIPFTMTEVL